MNGQKEYPTQNIDANEQNDYPNISKREAGIFEDKQMRNRTNLTYTNGKKDFTDINKQAKGLS